AASPTPRLRRWAVLPAPSAVQRHRWAASAATAVPTAAGAAARGTSAPAAPATSARAAATVPVPARTADSVHWAADLPVAVTGRPHRAAVRRAAADPARRAGPVPQAARVHSETTVPPAVSTAVAACRTWGVR